MPNVRTVGLELGGAVSYLRTGCLERHGDLRYHDLDVGLLLKQVGRAAPITPEDVEIGREEIGRLERMIASLRTLEPPAPHLERVHAAFPVERALHLLRAPIREKRLVVSVELPEDLWLTAQPDLAVQLFANLLRNAVQAAEPKPMVAALARQRRCTPRESTVLVTS